MQFIIVLLLFSLNVFAQEEESEALKALRLSCQQNVGLGCYNYANMLLKRDQQENANKYFEMGCKLEHSDSCVKKSWGSVESAAPVETASQVETTSSEPDISSTEVSTSEESLIEETPSPSPASTEEPIQMSAEDQVSGEPSPEPLSPEETELDLSAIE